MSKTFKYLVCKSPQPLFYSAQSSEQVNSTRSRCVSDSWFQTLGNSDPPARNLCHQPLHVLLRHLSSLERTSFFLSFQVGCRWRGVTVSAACGWFMKSCDKLGRGRSHTNSAPHQKQIDFRNKHVSTYSELEGKFEHF